MQQGELTVTGTDKVSIPLHKFPSEVHARFKHDLEVVPCNPHHADTLEFDVHHSNTTLSGFVLVISWSVAGVREIVWRASY
jgi:hypothetical protein